MKRLNLGPGLLVGGLLTAPLVALMVLFGLALIVLVCVILLSTQPSAA